MNTTKAMELIKETDEKVKKITETRTKLNFALVILEEINKLESPPDVIGKFANFTMDAYEGDILNPINVESLFNPGELEELVRTRAESVATQKYMELLTLTGETVVPVKESEAALEVPEPVSPKLETPESGSVENGIIIPRNMKIDDDKIEELYFKQGKGAKEIAQLLGIGYSTVRKHVNEIQQAKEKLAKECVRR